MVTVENFTQDFVVAPLADTYFLFEYRRAIEMQETQARAMELTNMAEGKHHIGDFLPPDELARFMEKVGHFEAIHEKGTPFITCTQVIQECSA